MQVHFCIDVVHNFVIGFEINIRKLGLTLFIQELSSLGIKRELFGTMNRREYREIGERENTFGAVLFQEFRIENGGVLACGFDLFEALVLY